MASAIETKALKIGYRLPKGGVSVVHPGLDLRLPEGGLTCLLGLNGAGKSTLIKTLCGFIPSLGGEMTICGKPFGEYSHAEFSRTVGAVLTERNVAGGITVYELVSLGRYPHTGFFGRLTERDHEIVRKAIDSVGIADKSARFISELSDGERQKAFIAKALAQECPVIILDEPTAFLDVTSRIGAMVLLRDIARTEHRSILLSTHDLDTALQFADNLWLQDGGSPMLSGSPEELIADGSLERFFSRDGLRFDPLQRRIVVSE